MCFKHLFFVDVESNQSMSCAASLGYFCVFFLGLSSLLKRSLFYSVDFIDVNEDVCDTTDSNNGKDDGDNNNKKSINNQLDTVNPVDRDDLTRGGFDNLDDFFFVYDQKQRLTVFNFCGGIKDRVRVCYSLT